MYVNLIAFILKYNTPTYNSDILPIPSLFDIYLLPTTFSNIVVWLFFDFRAFVSFSWKKV